MALFRANCCVVTDVCRQASSGGTTLNKPPHRNETYPPLPRTSGPSRTLRFRRATTAGVLLPCAASGMQLILLRRFPMPPAITLPCACKVAFRPCSGVSAVPLTSASEADTLHLTFASNPHPTRPPAPTPALRGMAAGVSRAPRRFTASLHLDQGISANSFGC